MKWIEKYDPKTLDDMVLSDSIREQFRKIIKSGEITHMTLSGIQGIGKTTLAVMIAKEVNAISLFIPCGSKGTIDVMRGEVENFCSTRTIDGRLKIVILDEADSISGGDRESSGQKSLTNIIEAHKEDTTFILTCNRPNMIMAPIISRCPPLSIRYKAQDVLKRLRYIMDTEGVKYTKDSLTKFANVVIKPCYPDIRRMITVLQNCCAGGELVISDIEEISSDAEGLATTIIEKLGTSEKINEIRKLVMHNRGVFDDNFQKFASILFNKVSDSITNTKALQQLTHCVYKIDQVVDKEIQLYSMLITIRDSMK